MRSNCVVASILFVLSATMSWGVEPAATATPSEPPLAPGLTIKDQTTIDAPVNLLTVASATNADGTVNVIVEIPSGTNAKWEVKEDGQLRWDIKDGKPRVVKYLGYVGDYGMVPRTKQGDGDPIDILLLAPAYARGTLLPVRVIGAALFNSENEQDNKLLAVVPGTPLGNLTSLRELEEQFPGVSDIVRIWFEHYKGTKNALVFKGMAEKEDAMKLVKDAETLYEKEQAAKKPAGQ